MEIQLVPLLSTIVLIATLATLMLGVLSYVAFRLRERRRPNLAANTAGKRFFVRLNLPEDAKASEAR
jgi:hypothetical protein